MKRTLLFSTLVVALLGGAQLVAAADLPRKPPPAPMLAPTPVYNWTGIYFGINGGYGWGHQDPLNLITNRFDGKSVDFSGGVFGGTFGAQIQSGHVVIGFEADLDWAGLKGSSTFIPTVGGVPIGAAAVSANANIDWEATARARFGYAEQNWLIYGTAGLAILGTKGNITTPPAINCGTYLGINCSGASKQVGAVLGAGVEYGFTPNLSAKFEYLYLSATSLDTSHHSEIRAGLNYRFGGL
jgi:outer membrane immunogenic protein